MKRVVIDSNVIISGLFFKGNEMEILDQAVSGDFKTLISPEILKEVETVILRKFEGIRTFLDALKLFELFLDMAKMVPGERYECLIPQSKKMLRDVKDVPILAMALFSKPDFLVTGDKDFHALKAQMDFKIV